MIAPCLILLSATVAGPVELRGGVHVSAPIIDVSPDGVQVGGDEPRIIPWDQVRTLDPEWSAAAEQFSAVSDSAWRARVRLARGDAPLAAPLFEDLFPRYKDRRSVLALMIAEGVYQCRYNAGDAPGAFQAWLVAANLRAQGLEIAGDPPLKPLLDPESHLPREFAPIFLSGPDARRVADAAAEALALPAGSLADEIRPVVAAYRIAALHALGEGLDEPLPTPAAPSGEIAALPSLIVRSTSVDSAERSTARDGLGAFLAPSHQGSWKEAWARAAIGRSLLLESDTDLRSGGVLQLLHLPARFADSQPDLCAIALAETANELRRMNDDSAASHLRDELRRLAPGHDAVAWLDRAMTAPQPSDPPPPGDPP